MERGRSYSSPSSLGPSGSVPGPAATRSNMPQPNKDSSVDHRPPPPPHLSSRHWPTSYRSGRSPRGRSLSSRPMRTPPYRLLLLSAQPSRYSVQDINIAPDIPKSWHCSRSPRGAWEVVQLALLLRSIRFRAGTRGHTLQHASAQQGLLCGQPSSSSSSYKAYLRRVGHFTRPSTDSSRLCLYQHGGPVLITAWFLYPDCLGPSLLFRGPSPNMMGPLQSTKLNAHHLLHLGPWLRGSGHETVAVLLPGFAISW